MELSNFFSAAEGRLDRWRTLHRLAQSLVGVAGRDAEALRQEAQKLLADMGPIEDFCAYPGPRLMAQLHERLQTGDWTGFARLVQRISNALMTNSYRDSTEAWKAEEETEERPTDILPPSIGRGQSRKPYFEVLMVSPSERSMWPEIREVFRRLRRVEDPFIYEPVIVGSFEDAVLATVFNYNLQAVVISDGFGFPSQYNVPILREILLKEVQMGEGAQGATRDLGTTLARMIRRWRPEMDVYLTTDRDVGALAGSNEAAPISRVFYAVEEPMEIHLAILDGIKDRYETPYFDNLKKYASRPIGTFMRCPSPAGSRSSSRTGSATWASSTAQTSSSQNRRQLPAASTACSSPPATSR